MKKLSKLTKAFNESAAAAHDAFPAQLKDLVVFSSAMKTPVYVAPEIADKLSKNTEAVKRAIESASGTMQRMNAVGLASPFYPVAGAYAKLIALVDKPNGVYTKGNTQQMRSFYVLDHEIGHHVVDSGRGKGAHLGEAAADAFGVLRHVQRFGLKTRYFAYGGAKAYTAVLGGSPIHYTQAIFERVKMIAGEQDVSKLTLQETARLADTIAREESFDAPTLARITRAYVLAGNTYRKAFGTNHDITTKLYAQDPEAYALFIRETVAVMKKNAQDRDVVKAGQQFFNYPPMKKFIDARAGTDAAYAEAQSLMTAPLPPPYVYTVPPGFVQPPPAVSRG